MIELEEDWLIECMYIEGAFTEYHDTNGLTSYIHSCRGSGEMHQAIGHCYVGRHIHLVRRTGEPEPAGRTQVLGRVVPTVSK